MSSRKRPKTDYEKDIAKWSLALKKAKDSCATAEVQSIYNNLGRIHRQYGFFEEALKAHISELSVCKTMVQQAARLSSFEEFNALSNKAIAERNIADCYMNLQDYKPAISHFLKQLDSATQAHDNKEQQRAHVGLFEAFSSLAESKKSDSSSQDSLDRKQKITIENDIDQLFEKAYSHAIKSLELAKLIPPYDQERQEMIIRSHINIGICESERYKFIDAILQYNNVLDLTKDTNYIKEQSRAFCNLGHAYLELNNLEMAEDYFLKDLQLCQQQHIQNWTEGQPLAWRNLGDCFNRAAKFSDAITCYTKFEELASPSQKQTAIQRLEMAKNRQVLSERIDQERLDLDRSESRLQNDQILARLKMLHQDAFAIDRYKDARAFLRRRIKLLKRMEQSNKIQLSIAEDLAALSEALDKDRRYDEALDAANESLRISEFIKNDAGIAQAHWNIGNILESKGAHTDSVRHYKKSFQFAKKCNDLEMLLSALENMDYVYRKTNRKVERFEVIENIAFYTDMKQNVAKKNLSSPTSSPYFAFPTPPSLKSVENSSPVVKTHSQLNCEITPALVRKIPSGNFEENEDDVIIPRKRRVAVTPNQTKKQCAPSLRSVPKLSSMQNTFTDSSELSEAESVQIVGNNDETSPHRSEILADHTSVHSASQNSDSVQIVENRAQLKNTTDIYVNTKLDFCKKIPCWAKDFKLDCTRRALKKFSQNIELQNYHINHKSQHFFESKEEQILFACARLNRYSNCVLEKKDAYLIQLVHEQLQLFGQDPSILMILMIIPTLGNNIIDWPIGYYIRHLMQLDTYWTAFNKNFKDFHASPPRWLTIVAASHGLEITLFLRLFSRCALLYFSSLTLFTCEDMLENSPKPFNNWIYVIQELSRLKKSDDESLEETSDLIETCLHLANIWTIDTAIVELMLNYSLKNRASRKCKCTHIISVIEDINFRPDHTNLCEVSFWFLNKFCQNNNMPEYLVRREIAHVRKFQGKIHFSSILHVVNILITIADCSSFGDDWVINQVKNIICDFPHHIIEADGDVFEAAILYRIKVNLLRDKFSERLMKSFIDSLKKKMMAICGKTETACKDVILGPKLQEMSLKSWFKELGKLVVMGYKNKPLVTIKIGLFILKELDLKDIVTKSGELFDDVIELLFLLSKVDVRSISDLYVNSEESKAHHEYYRLAYKTTLKIVFTKIMGLQEKLNDKVGETLANLVFYISQYESSEELFSELSQRFSLTSASNRVMMSQFWCIYLDKSAIYREVQNENIWVHVKHLLVLTLSGWESFPKPREDITAKFLDKVLQNGIKEYLPHLIVEEDDNNMQEWMSKGNRTLIIGSILIERRCQTTDYRVLGEIRRLFTVIQDGKRWASETYAHEKRAKIAKLYFSFAANILAIMVALFPEVLVQKKALSTILGEIGEILSFLEIASPGGFRGMLLSILSLTFYGISSIPFRSQISCVQFLVQQTLICFNRHANNCKHATGDKPNATNKTEPAKGCYLPLLFISIFARESFDKSIDQKYRKKEKTSLVIKDAGEGDEDQELKLDEFVKLVIKAADERERDRELQLDEFVKFIFGEILPCTIRNWGEMNQSTWMVVDFLNLITPKIQQRKHLLIVIVPLITVLRQFFFTKFCGLWCSEGLLNEEWFMALDSRREMERGLNARARQQGLNRRELEPIFFRLLVLGQNLRAKIGNLGSCEYCMSDGHKYDQCECVNCLYRILIFGGIVMIENKLRWTLDITLDMTISDFVSWLQSMGMREQQDCLARQIICQIPQDCPNLPAVTSNFDGILDVYCEFLSSFPVNQLVEMNIRKQDRQSETIYYALDLLGEVVLNCDKLMNEKGDLMEQEDIRTCSVELRPRQSIYRLEEVVPPQRGLATDLQFVLKVLKKIRKAILLERKIREKIFSMNAHSLIHCREIKKIQER